MALRKRGREPPGPVSLQPGSTRDEVVAWLEADVTTGGAGIPEDVVDKVKKKCPKPDVQRSVEGLCACNVRGSITCAASPTYGCWALSPQPTQHRRFATLGFVGLAQVSQAWLDRGEAVDGSTILEGSMESLMEVGFSRTVAQRIMSRVRQLAGPSTQVAVQGASPHEIACMLSCSVAPLLLHSTNQDAVAPL